MLKPNQQAVFRQKFPVDGPREKCYYIKWLHARKKRVTYYSAEGYMKALKELRTMESGTRRINIKKLVFYILKRCWLIILCAAIGFAGMYWYTAYYQQDKYTAYATVYVLNGNPNVVNYQYTNVNDLNSAVALLDTYKVVIKSDKVMSVVTERLIADYPWIFANYIASTLSMGSVSETGVFRIMSTTSNAKLSADICNAVVDVAPSEIIRVVNAGNIEVIDYAVAPSFPDDRSPMRKGLIGAMAGAILAAGFLVLLFLLNRKVADAESLTDNYTPPVLAEIHRKKASDKDPARFLLDNDSQMETVESYAKLRMNLLYTLAGKETKAVAISSAIAGEGKSTIAANLAISCAMSGKKVVLVDADIRRACQRDHFKYEEDKPGLSEIMIGESQWQDTLIPSGRENLDILPAGHAAPNPAELLSLPAFPILLAELEQHYDLILFDTPPINVVSDPLALSSHVAGCVMVIRQNYSDHREIRKSLIAAEMAGMNILGFVFYGEKLKHSKYYGKRYYQKYYSRYEKQAEK